MHALLTITAPAVLAQEDGAGALFSGLLPLVFLIAIFYFLLIRPQQKRAKQQRELVQSLEVGDRIVTLGGVHGTVQFVDDDIMHLEVAPGTTMTFSRQSVARRLVDADSGADSGEEV